MAERRIIKGEHWWEPNKEVIVEKDFWTGEEIIYEKGLFGTPGREIERNHEDYWTDSTVSTDSTTGEEKRYSDGFLETKEEKHNRDLYKKTK